MKRSEDLQFEYLLEYVRVMESQYEYSFSQERLERIRRIHEQMKELAFICEGQASLDIHEEERRAELVYRGPYIMLAGEECRAIREALSDLIMQSYLFYMDVVDGELHISVEEPLVDKELVRDQSQRLEELRREMKSKG